MLAFIMGESNSGKTSLTYKSPEGVFAQDIKEYKGIDPDTTLIINSDKKGMSLLPTKFKCSTPKYLLSPDRLKSKIMGKDNKEVAITRDYIANVHKHNIATLGDRMIKETDILIIKDILNYVSNKMPTIKVVVIDTINNIMNTLELGEDFQERKTGGEARTRYLELAIDIFWLVEQCNILRDDLNIYLYAHTITDEDGKTHIVTNGRKIEKIQLESKSDVVLLAKREDLGEGNSVFTLQTSAYNSSARSPLGMFKDFTITPSLVLVDNRIREYYNIK